MQIKIKTQKYKNIKIGESAELECGDKVYIEYKNILYKAKVKAIHMIHTNMGNIKTVTCEYVGKKKTVLVSKRRNITY